MTEASRISDLLECAGIQAASDLDEEFIGDLDNWQPTGVRNEVDPTTVTVANFRGSRRSRREQLIECRRLRGLDTP